MEDEIKYKLNEIATKLDDLKRLNLAEIKQKLQDLNLGDIKETLREIKSRLEKIEEKIQQ